MKKEEKTALEKKIPTKEVRKRQGETEIAETLKGASTHGRYRRKPRTEDETMAWNLNRSIDFAMDTLKQAGHGKVDLSDPDAIRSQTETFLKACKAAGVIPTFEKLIASMGYSRQWVYKYMREHAGNESVNVLDNIHTIFANVMTDQALYRNFCENTTKILLKKVQADGDLDDLSPTERGAE